jgi:hypothetical protein
VKASGRYVHVSRQAYRGVASHGSMKKRVVSWIWWIRVRKRGCVAKLVGPRKVRNFANASPRDAVAVRW